MGLGRRRRASCRVPVSLAVKAVLDPNPVKACSTPGEVGDSTGDTAQTCRAQARALTCRGQQAALQPGARAREGPGGRSPQEIRKGLLEKAPHEAHVGVGTGAQAGRGSLSVGEAGVEVWPEQPLAGAHLWQLRCLVRG